MVGKIVSWRMGSGGSVGAIYERNGPVSLFTTTLPLNMANRKEGFILKEGDIHGHKILARWRMVILVAMLVQRIPHKKHMS